MAKLTKNNYKKFSRRNLLPNTDGSKPSGAAADRIFQQNIKLLERFCRYYDSLQDFRTKRERCKKYYFGDQLSDLVDDAEGCGKITEEENQRKLGMTPMSLNIIRKAVKAVLGVYCQSNLEPLAIARDRDEQKLGEMMSVAMEYFYQNRNAPEVNTRGCEEFLMSSLVGFRVGYGIDPDRKTSDVTLSLVDNNRIVFDPNTSGQYFENITCIGYLHDMPRGDALRLFAHSQREAEQIQKIFDNCTARMVNDQQFSRSDRKNQISFYQPLQPELCRVYEIWTREDVYSLYCHDIRFGEPYYVDVSEEPNIIAENNRRIMEMVENGGKAEDAATIDYKWSVENKWVVRYLTPDGYVLHQEETPYWHGSHPFVIGAFPLVDGEIHSFVEDAINPQRMTNRLFARIEYQRMNDVKGIFAIQKKVRERSNMTVDQIAAKITSPAAVIELDWEEGEEPFKQYHSTSNTQGDVQMLTQYMNLMNEMTGAHGAMRGEQANSGTPASLYAQETQNANNNIADMLQWYNGLIRKRDYKIMQLIQQYYTERRYLNIAGKDYSEEAKWYDPEKVRNSKFDLALIENQSSGVFRAQNENLLITLLTNGAIDVETYLESSTSPFADKMLERIKQKQQEAADAQADIQAQQAPTQQQAAAMQNAVPQNAIPGQVPVG